MNWGRGEMLIRIHCFTDLLRLGVSSAQICLIYNLFEIKLILLKSDVIYYFGSYVFAL